ncbi:MAG: Asp-tRNA(Asn)/Glu-tRNA(Gln) amidotransferase subunit GatB [Patescibacteria group bacterium]
MDEFKTTIGLEIHCQLKTKSKMFCSCDNDAEGKEPNQLTCPVCLAMPGTLPVANREAIEMTVMTGIAMGCEIPKESKFDRKHYFYPDLPKGFQISQYDQPLCKGGMVEIKFEIRNPNDESNLKSEIRKIRLNRIHLEEDAGKLIHPKGKDYSLVDLNRAGTPLMEIVTEPDIISPAEAKKFMEELQLVVRYLGVSDADMEKGHLRCDANISVQKNGKSSPIVEIKNLNSFRFVEQALLFEEKRLRDDYDNWPEKRQKITRGFDSDKGTTFEQRRKEEAADYRYFPEPDVPPISFTEDQLNILKSKVKKLPKVQHQKYISAGIRDDVADKIIRQPHLVEYLENAKELEKDLVTFVAEQVKADDTKKVSILDLADLVNLTKAGIISKTVAKEVYGEMVNTGKKAAEIIKEKGLEQVSDNSELESQINEVIKENPELVEKYKSGKTSVIGFFVGKVMQKTKGKANPQLLNNLLKEKLDGNNY